MQNFIEKPTSKLKKGTRKAEETWIEEQCQGIEETPQKNNSNKSNQLLKELTSSKQGRTTNIQDKAGKYLTEEQDLLKRWTEYCSKMYTHTTSDPKMLDVPSPTNSDNYPILQEEVEASVKITEERQVGRSGQHSIGAGPGRRRGHDRYVTHHMQ